MPHGIADDDLVRTHDEAAGNEREPLLVLEPLMAFLDEAGLGSGELEVVPVGDGHSNVTYAVTRDGADVVLRRPPRPPLPPSAHDVLREARVLAALDGRGVRVPKVLAVGDDESIIGAPFYVMERMQGELIVDAVPSELDTPEQRRRIGDELVDALVEMHAADWRAAGLEGFGKPQGYLERQLRRFAGLWEHNRTRDLPAVETVGEWLRSNLPESGEATVVHGDYRLGNTIVHPTEPRVIAVLDWELSTLGHPLADLGYNCMIWHFGEGFGASEGYAGMDLAAFGIPSEKDYVAAYARRTGRQDIPDWDFYVAFSLFRLAAIVQGVYKRGLDGNASSETAKSYGDRARVLADLGWSLVKGRA